MITAVFKLNEEKQLIGFSMEGHAGYADSGEDIICAGVSSALMLTVNTITDFIGAEAEVDVDPDNEGLARLTLSPPYDPMALIMIKSFYEHLRILEEQYGHIKVHTEA